MIDISVVAYNGAATSPLVGRFDELGGNIGRAENNQMVLPDPERTISRVHAQVVFRDGRYAIVDRGSNPITVNGRPLGNGQEALIQPGDELQIGGYTMRVEASAPAGGAAAADPFADFAGLAAPAAAPGGGAGRGAAAPSPFADPLAGFGAAPARPAAAPRSPPPSPPPAASAAGIPADWDPFAPEPASRAPAPSSPLGLPGAGNFGLDVGGRADSLIPDFAPGNSKSGGGDSLDALFGLGGGLGGADPLAGSVLNPAAAQPNMAAHHDPLKSLNSVTKGGATSAPDTSSELSSPFQLPPMTPQQPQPPRAAPAAPAARPTVARPATPPPARPAAAPAAVPARPPAPQAAPPARPPVPPAAMPARSTLPAAAPPAPFIPPTSFHSGFGGAVDIASPAPPAWPAASAEPRALPVDATAPPGSVLSWDDPSGESRTVIRPRGAAPVADLDLDLGFGDEPPAPPTPVPTPRPPPPPAGPSAAARPPPPRPATAAPAAQPMPAQAAAAPPAPAPRAPAPARVAPASPAGTPAWRPPPGVAAPAQPSPAAAAAGHAAAPGEIAALAAALREGLGVPSLPPESLVLTPALMRLMGRLVHEATRGTVELLVARAALKREIRAEVTMIVAKENNPLKFSPSAEVALGHLLQPPVRGFMAGDQAMRDAYDDLRAHQFGFLAGMRAALEGILHRFDPKVLEGKLTQKSRLSALLPAKRKAQMWDVFTELYGQISSEASDDFHELFGKEFLRAYNEYIDQLGPDRP